jgi:hypothetical protein
VPFVNPFTGITFPSVLYTDYYEWDAISGERFPPTLTSASYSTFKGRTCYLLATGASAALCPALPRIGPAQTVAAVYTLEASLALPAGAAAQFKLLPYATDDANLFLQKQGFTGLLELWFTHPTLGFGSVKFTDTITDGQWHSIIVTITESGATATIDLAVDGARPTITSWVTITAGTQLPVSYVSSALFCPQVKVTSADASNHYASRLKVTWS